MNKDTLKTIGLYGSLFLIWVCSFKVIPMVIGHSGFFGTWFETHTFFKMALIWVATAHVTIAAMSIAFHRVHTHQSVKLHRSVDYAMQTFLWGITSMSKPDWVSVHVYHHTHSDQEHDPHSPKQKGIFRVFFMGAYDYTMAKAWPEVLKIRKRIPLTKYERFISEHPFLAPGIFTAILMLLFGPIYGSILGALNFSISPLFAVGGVNALAHSYGYKNYDSKDESGNLGFLVFLNWIICGELDHNNHHKYPKSPTFAHRWFEFDIGWVYIRLMQGLKLATVTGNIPKYRALVQSARSHSQSEVAFVS
jgi:stearoyl-CoA desaturase (delta-9 desaturase)